MANLVSYLVAFFVATVPVGMHAYREAPDITLERYESVAEDIAEVSLDPEEAPLFHGAHARERTALVLASIASFESSLRADVDDCSTLGDGGRSRTIFQIQRGTPLVICEDRRAAAHVALSMVRESLAACAGSPADERLALYTSGSCERGRRQAQWRWARAVAFYRSHPLDPVD